MAHDTRHGFKPWQRLTHRHEDDHVHTDRYGNEHAGPASDTDLNTDTGRDTGYVAGAHRDHTADPAPGDARDARYVDREVDREDRQALGHKHARDRFGGVNGGAAFFGWLVAIAMTVLLMSIVGAVASAVGSSTNFDQGDAEREAGAVGLAAAIALVVVMMVAYYAGGYVAGRMSRFDGARQGVAVWVLGLVITLLAVALGWIFGDQYNVLDRVDLPRFPIPTDAATIGGIITAAALLIGTLIAAMAGGKVGHRYHDKVDRAAWF